MEGLLEGAGGNTLISVNAQGGVACSPHPGGRRECRVRRGASTRDSPGPVCRLWWASTRDARPSVDRPLGAAGSSHLQGGAADRLPRCVGVARASRLPVNRTQYPWAMPGRVRPHPGPVHDSSGPPRTRAARLPPHRLPCFGELVWRMVWTSSTWPLTSMRVVRPAFSAALQHPGFWGSAQRLRGRRRGISMGTAAREPQDRLGPVPRGIREG